MTADLGKYIAVPKSPIDIDESRMKANAATLNIQFPNDFLEFGRTYGSGTLIIEKSKKSRLCEYEIYSPAFANYSALVEDFFERQNAHREATENAGLRLGLFPEPGGLLPFGYSSRGDYLTWKTVSQPDDWIICQISTYDDSGYHLYARPFKEFLIGFLSRQFRLDGFSDYNWDPETDIRFEPRVISY